LSKEGLESSCVNKFKHFIQSAKLRKKETVKRAWDCLKEIFESKGPVRKATLYKQLLRMEKKANVTITQHVNGFTSKAGQLEEVGIEISSELLFIMLLNSLPEEYKNFSIAMESRDNIPTLEILKAKLKEEEARQNARNAKMSDGKSCNALMAKRGANRGRRNLYEEIRV